MARVLLTRELASDDPTRLMLAAAGHEVHGLAMLDFDPLPIALPDHLDWLFAYSRQGVRAICAAGVLAEAFRQNPALRLGAVGPGTAREWRARGWAVDFEGEGGPEAVAEQFAARAQGSRVAFLQAEGSRQSIQRLLAGRLQAHAVVCYRAVPAGALLPAGIDVYLLTSPRSALLALAGAPKDSGARIYCIGEPTATSVRELGFLVSGVAPRPEIAALVEMVCVAPQT